MAMPRIPRLNSIMNSIVITLFLVFIPNGFAFAFNKRFSTIQLQYQKPLSLFVLPFNNQNNYEITGGRRGRVRTSDLPRGISPFEKSEAKSLDLPSDFRRRATEALIQARKDGKVLLEIEFPPLLFRGKTQFDDFDNVQELNLNRDWCIEWLPTLATGVVPSSSGGIWMILPDLKECELAKEEWRGGRYLNSAQFTTIEVATRHYTGDSNYRKPWGASFATAMSTLMSGGSTNRFLGDSRTLDPLDGNPEIHLLCQPGNGGPVEDWVNCEILHTQSEKMASATSSSPTTTVIVNGALDKVRDGYYPAVFFPELASTVDRFYKKFESIFYLRPLSDKGCYGWLYRVYPEPWQVVLQTTKSSGSKLVVENIVVYTSETRPTFAFAIDKLIQGATAASRREV